MKTLEEFKQYYDQTMKPYLTELEKRRKKVMQRVAALHIIMVVIAVLLIIFLGGLFLNGVSLIIYAIIWAILYFCIAEKYIDDFKKKVISQIVSFIDENLGYAQNSPEDNKHCQDFFIESRLFKYMPTSFFVEDLVSGRIGTVDLGFAEISAQRGSGKSQRIIFNGLLFIADFNKKFKGATFVLPNKAEGFLGEIGTALHSKKNDYGELIKLEDAEFEKFFVTYGSDQIEARYILSLSLMRRIIDLRNKAEVNIHISFVDSKIFIAIPCEDFLEPHIFGSLLDFNQMSEYFDTLQLVIGIVEDLNLNTKIWGNVENLSDNIPS